jgi:GDPmannose 4,6-dehydratase
MPTALVTGISGQDGGYLAERLLDEGWQVHGLVHSADAERGDLRKRLPSVVLHEGDLADAAGLAALVDAVVPDEIYNLGGLSSVALSWRSPVLTAQVTGLGAAALLDAAWRLGQRLGREIRVLQASSAEVFGVPEQSPQNETTPLRPVSPYGAAKAFAHHLVGVYRGRGLYAAACILYNHESPRRPVDFVTRKITRAATRIAAGRQRTLALGTLEVRRDWGWAPDYVDAMVRAIRHDEPDDYVVATGETHSIEEFVAASFDRAGIKDWRDHVELDPSFARPVEAPELIGDASKARAVLGWQPKVSFEELVRLMVERDRLDIENGEVRIT